MLANNKQLSATSQSNSRPTFVSRIDITGTVTRDMYDDHPGYAFFYVDASKTVLFPPFCSLDRAIDIAIRAFAVLQADSDAIEDGDEAAGQFAPSSVNIFDGPGNVIFQFQGTRESAEQQLVAPLPPTRDHESLLHTAAELRGHASVESGWDNFSTADGLSKQSEAIMMRVSCARNFGAVTKAEPMRGLEIRARYSLQSIRIRFHKTSCKASHQKMRAIIASASCLGHFEALNGVTEPPAMFADVSELKDAWLKGAKELADDLQSLAVDQSRDCLLLL